MTEHIAGFLFLDSLSSGMWETWNRALFAKSTHGKSLLRKYYVGNFE